MEVEGTESHKDAGIQGDTEETTTVALWSAIWRLMHIPIQMHTPFPTAAQ